MSVFDDDPSKVISKQLLIFVVVIYVIIVVWQSVEQWNIHPRQFICPKQTKPCRIVGYSYHKTFCWGSTFRRRGYYRKRRCVLPKYKEFEVELYPLKDIDKAKMVSKDGQYLVYIVNKNGQEVNVGTYKDYDLAVRMTDLYNRQVKNWMDSLNSEFLRDDIDFVHDFEDSK